jgi:putative ABC transport system permease protein
VTATRLALRIALREIKRCKGRSAAAVLLIMVPVLALGYLAVTYDMFTLSAAERYTQRYGAADAALTWRYAGPIEQDWSAVEVSAEDADLLGEPKTAAQLAQVLPPGSRVTPMDRGDVTLRTAAGIGQLPGFALDAADPLTAGLVRVRRGTPPRGEHEMAVTTAAARRLGVPLGGTVHSGRSAGAWQVTAIVEFPADLGEIILFPAEQLPADADRTDPTTWLAATGTAVTWARVHDLNRRGIVVAAQVVYGHGRPAQTVDVAGIGALVAAAGVVEVMLLAGPAFAIGARRRRRELGLIAVHGGTGGHLYRIVLADGVLLGAVAAVVGVLVAVAAAFLTRPLIETYVVGQRAGGYRVFPLALAGAAGTAVLSGVLAAFLPAVAAARISPIAALGGARSAARGSRFGWLIGLLATAAGLLLGAHGATRLDRKALVGGVLLAQAGLILLAPAVVDLAARAGRRLPLPLRMAVRDAGRNRLTAAPAICAVMASVAGTVVAGVLLASGRAQTEAAYHAGLPTGAVLVSYGVPAERDKATDIARRVLRPRTTVEVGGIACRDDGRCDLNPLLPADRRCFMLDLGQPFTSAQQRAARKDPRCAFDGGGHQDGESIGYAVGGADLVAAATDAPPADLARARRTLDAGGVVVRDWRYVVDGRVTLTVRNSTKPGNGQEVGDEKLPRLSVPGYVLTTGAGGGQVFFSPAAVRRAGFAVRPSGLLVRTAGTPTQAQEDRLRSELLALSREASTLLVVERGADRGPGSLTSVLEIVAVLVTLGAAIASTGLAAAERQRDLIILGAVGAAPGFRRALTVAQTGLIAVLGSLLGLVSGLATIYPALTAYNSTAAPKWPIVPALPLVLPGRTLLVVAVTPLVAMLGAALFARSRLPSDRRAG